MTLIQMRMARRPRKLKTVAKLTSKPVLKERKLATKNLTLTAKPATRRRKQLMIVIPKLMNAVIKKILKKNVTPRTLNVNKRRTAILRILIVNWKRKTAIPRRTLIVYWTRKTAIPRRTLIVYWTRKTMNVILNIKIANLRRKLH
jgi:hypothetical protein